MAAGTRQERHWFPGQHSAKPATRPAASQRHIASINGDQTHQQPREQDRQEHVDGLVTDSGGGEHQGKTERREDRRHASSGAAETSDPPLRIAAATAAAPSMD